MSIHYLNLKSLDETLEDIRDSVHPLESGLKMSAHPLYHTLWTHEALDLEDKDPHGNPIGGQAWLRKIGGQAWLRKHIEHKLGKLQWALGAEDWDTFIFLHERPYRASVCCELVSYKMFHPCMKPDLIRSVWVNTENAWQHSGTWDQIFGRMTPECFNEILDEDEQALRASLPDELTIWRGHDAQHGKAAQTSYSWTLDREKARWFAKRFSKEPVVTEAQVKKEMAAGPFNDRGESEIILLNPWAYKNRGQLIIKGETNEM